METIYKVEGKEVVWEEFLKTLNTMEYKLIESDNIQNLVYNHERAINIKIQSLKQELSATDYKAIKFAEGLIGKQEYESIKIERQRLRDEIKTYEKQLDEI